MNVFISSGVVNCYINKLSVSDDGNKMYGSGYDKDGNKAIWRINVSELLHLSFP